MLNKYFGRFAKASHEVGAINQGAHTIKSSIRCNQTEASGEHEKNICSSLAAVSACKNANSCSVTSIRHELHNFVEVGSDFFWGAALSPQARLLLSFSRFFQVLMLHLEYTVFFPLDMLICGCGAWAHGLNVPNFHCEYLGRLSGITNLLLSGQR